MLKRPVLLGALLVALAGPALAAGSNTRPGAEISTFIAPSLGGDFKGHVGGALSLALSATHEFEDSEFGELIIAQFEGIYLHSSGKNDIGGPRHRETLDAGFGLLNVGLGIRRDEWEGSVMIGAGFGGGSLSGDTTEKSLDLTGAIQVKPRLTYHFHKKWSVFIDYRYLRTGDSIDTLFSGSDGRALSMHGVGIGAGYTF